jgi:putative holliday junction resolvase
MRYLGVDIGAKRTGLAVGSDTLGMVSPVGIIQVEPKRVVEQLLKAVEEQGAGGVVMGLPLNMDGTEGPAALGVRKIAMALEKAAKVKVHLFDERLTSFEAEGMMAGRGMTRGDKKEVRDALAAKTLLEDFLRWKKGQDGAGV